MKDAAHSIYYYAGERILFSLNFIHHFCFIFSCTLLFNGFFFRSIFVLHDEFNSFGLFVCARIANCEASDKKNYIKKYITEICDEMHSRYSTSTFNISLYFGPILFASTENAWFVNI